MTRALSSLFVFLIACSALAAGRELEAPVIGPTGFSLGLSSTAFAGDRFLTVWQSMSGTEVYGTFSDASGKRVSAESFHVLDAPRAWSMQLIGLGDTYALFWRDQFGGVHHAEINLDGSTSRRTRLLIDLYRPRAAWNGAYVLMVGASTASSFSEAIILNRAGEVLRRTVIGQLGHPHGVIALDDGSFFVIGSNGNALRGVTISRAGELLSEIVIDPAGPSVFGDRDKPDALALPGGRVMVAYAVGPQDLRIAVLSGSEVVSRQVLIPEPYVEVRDLHLARHASTLAIYFRGLRGQTNGQVWDMAGFAVNEQGRPLHTRPLVVAHDVPAPSFFSRAAGSDVSLAVGSGWPGQVLAYALTSPATAIQPEVVSLTPSLQSAVHVGGNASGFLAVWGDRAGDSAIHSASVDATGERKSAITAFPGSLMSRTVASGPAGHLFIRWIPGGQLIASLVGSEGTLLRDVVLASTFGDAAAVWTSSGFLVAWTNGAQIFTALLSADGADPVVNELSLPALPPRFGRRASKLLLAFDSENALLVWDEAVLPLCNGIPGDCNGEFATEVLASRLSPSGAAVDRQPVVLTRQNSPLLAGGDGQFLLYTHQDRSARVITTAGPAIQVGDPTMIPLGSYTIEDLIWSGDQYVAATRGAGTYAGVIHLDERGRTLEPMRVTPAEGWINSVRIATSGGQQLIVGAVTEKTSSTRARAFGDFEFRATPPSPPANPIAAVGITPGEETLVSWEPVANADGYVIEVFIEGQKFATILVEGHATTLETAYPASAEYRVRPFNAGGFFEPPVASRRRTSRQ